ncbi:MAG TPA: DUF3465 domain-containing protein [Planctomycetota bacterium]
MTNPPKKGPASLPRLVVLAVLAGAAWFAQSRGWLDGLAAAKTGAAETGTRTTAPRSSGGRTGATLASDGVGTIAAAVRDKRSGFMVQVEGTVRAVLADDDDGARHQRFILELADGATVLVAHNIDLAERVPLDRDDVVEVFGQFEFNDRGGVLHWTHHDPGKRHEEGWIRHDGNKYD